MEQEKQEERKGQKEQKRQQEQELDVKIEGKENQGKEDESRNWCCWIISIRRDSRKISSRRS